jgi:hypothetical protein
MVASSTLPLIDVIPTMTVNQLREISTTDLGSLSASDWGTLSGDQIRSFTVGQIASLSPEVLAALDPTTFLQFSRREIAHLTTTQVGDLTSSEVATLTRGKLAAMGADQLAVLSPAAFAGLGAGRVSSLSATQIAALTTTQFDALSPWEIQNVVSQDGAGVSLADLKSLSASQFAVLDPATLDALGGGALSQIAPALFSIDQIAGLTSAAISGLTTSFFSQLSSTSLAAISPSALAGVSVADMQALNATQLAGFSQTQMSAMNSAQLAVIGAFDPLILQATKLEVNGVLGVGGAKALLESVAAGGLNATTFAQLQDLGNKLETPDGVGFSGADDAILTTAATQQFFDNVVFGDAENSTWNGGAVQSTALGDLSAASTASQFGALIDKWFGGADLPSLQIDTAGAVSSATYAPNASPLYDPSGSPSMTDVLQGGLADSALLAGIAETALQDPGYINQLITANGDGTYQVEIPNMFSPIFVTVNNDLPTGAGGAGMAAATSATGLWVGLLEKAAAQSAVDSAIINGDGAGSTLGNSYASLTLNNDSQVELYSGQFSSQAMFAPNDSQSQLNQLLTGAQNAFSHGNNVILDAGNQFFAVTGVDAAHGWVSVYNPMGGTNSTITSAAMAAGGDTLYFGVTGRAAA